MKKKGFVFIISLFISTNAGAKTYIGKISQIKGNIDLTYISTGERFNAYVGTQINSQHKIRTGRKSSVEILLNNGTKIFLKEISVLNISSCKLKQKDPPTRIQLLTGKVRMNISKPMPGRNMILQTPTAFVGASTIATDFAVITSKVETKAVVFNGQLDLASSNSNIIKSYRLRRREEASIKKNFPPDKPVILPSEILDSWFDYYEIIDRKRIIVKSRKEDGIIGHILRKREF